ncbi:hypothetical protein FH586_15615 [Leptospira weilii]|nr:hypothetical protein [Leptospira weilii]ULH30611.1 hypothetical protein FH586_15615 [Leptospira weilii]
MCIRRNWKIGRSDPGVSKSGRAMS